MCVCVCGVCVHSIFMSLCVHIYAHVQCVFVYIETNSTPHTGKWAMSD